MRILLVVSVALIGLFADQSSLFATLVYRYEYALHCGRTVSASHTFTLKAPKTVPISISYEPADRANSEAIYDFQS